MAPVFSHAHRHVDVAHTQGPPQKKRKLPDVPETTSRTDVPSVDISDLLLNEADVVAEGNVKKGSKDSFDDLDDALDIFGNELLDVPEDICPLSPEGETGFYDEVLPLSFLGEDMEGKEYEQDMSLPLGVAGLDDSLLDELFTTTDSMGQFGVPLDRSYSLFSRECETGKAEMRGSGQQSASAPPSRDYLLKGENVEAEVAPAVVPYESHVKIERNHSSSSVQDKENCFEYQTATEPVPVRKYKAKKVTVAPSYGLHLSVGEECNRQVLASYLSKNLENALKTKGGCAKMMDEINSVGRSPQSFSGAPRLEISLQPIAKFYKEEGGANNFLICHVELCGKVGDALFRNVKTKENLEKNSVPLRCRVLLEDGTELPAREQQFLKFMENPELNLRNLKAEIRFRLTKVSNNYNKQRLRLLVSVDQVPEIQSVMTDPVAVFSKRKRLKSEVRNKLNENALQAHMMEQAMKRMETTKAEVARAKSLLQF